MMFYYEYDLMHSKGLFYTFDRFRAFIMFYDYVDYYLFEIDIIQFG